MASEKIEKLSTLTAELRGRIIETSGKAKIPHLGSCLSCVDILVGLYWHGLNIDPENPELESRDRFLLSKGHAVPALAQLLALRGFFPFTELENYGSDGSLFAEHPPAHGVPGIEAATGSLGHGLPIAIGMALSSRIQGLSYKVAVLMGDGECNEGSVWEGAMMASAQKLEKLMVIIDYNKWQATGRSEEILALSPLADKWRAFGWRTYEIDGHDMTSIVKTLDQEPDGTGKPTAVIAHTIKGKGVSFMEDDNNWHYRTPTPEEILQAKKELGVSS